MGLVPNYFSVLFQVSQIAIWTQRNKGLNPQCFLPCTGILQAWAGSPALCYEEMHGERYVQICAERAGRRLLNLTLPRKELSAFAKSCQLWDLSRSSARLAGQVGLSNGNDMHMFSLMPCAPVWLLAKCSEHSTEKLGAILKPAVSLKTST